MGDGSWGVGTDASSSSHPPAPSSRRRRRLPWRYRWPDDFRDEVLARLLELNKHRAHQERLAGHAAEGTTKPKRKPARRNKTGGSNNPPLPGM